MPTTYNGTIYRPGAAPALVAKDPPTIPPKRYPITPPGGAWVADEKVSFELEDHGGTETAYNVAKRP